MVTMKLAILICLSALLSWGQVPTPAQGRDYVGSTYRVVAVDSTGRLIISPTGGGTCPNPCPVVGTAADGAAAAGIPPVIVAGVDIAGNLQFYAVDTSGRAIVVGGAADGVAVAGAPVRIGGKDNGGLTQDVETNAAGELVPANASVAGADGVSNTVATPATVAGAQLYGRIFPYLFNGTTNDRQIACTNSAAISLAAGTDVEIVPAGGVGTFVRICGFSFASDTTADMTIRQGTGTTCLTNTAALSGAYKNVLAPALDFGNWGALRTTVAARAVCLHFSTAVTAGGLVFYATAF